jgi:integrase
MYAVVLDGRRTWSRCRKGCTEEEARAEVDGARRALVVPDETTVAEAIEAHAQYLETVSSRTTANVVRAQLLSLKRLAGDVLVKRFSVAIVGRFLQALAEPVASANRKNAKPRAMATQRSYFQAAQRTSKWWAKHRYTATDVVQDYIDKTPDPLPWGTKAGRKAINRGKVQLRNLSEARRYLAAALARETAEERVAASLPILTGIASGELLHVQTGAVDFDAGVIHIRSEEAEVGDTGWCVKTNHRVRAITIPDAVRADLKALVAGLGPRTFVFRSIDERTKTGRKADWRRSDEPRTASWLLDLVHRVCRDAEVRTVCPHGLRATHASLRRIVVDEAVAKIGDALGHADHGRTAAAHYVGAAATEPVLRVLVGGGGA